MLQSITVGKNRVPRGLFIVGTDTGVGKTTFTRGLLRALLRAGETPVPYKPVETGVLEGVRSDAAALREAAGCANPLAEVCPFPFALPVAPVVAAAECGIRLSVAALVNAAPLGQPLIVESAGGLLSPVSPRETNADAAAAFAMPVVLVARNSLGTINHCALALAELGRRRINLAALVLVNVAAPGPDAATNAGCIEDLCGIRPRLILPFAPQASDEALANLVGACGPWL